MAGDLAGFEAVVEESDELRAVLHNPEIDTDAKRGVLDALMQQADAQPLVRNFLRVLVDRGRLNQLPEITAAFAERVAAATGRITIEAITAVPLTDPLRRAIVSRVAEQTGREVDLSESVDPEIVGGLLLRVGGVMVDGSVRQRLDDLGRTRRPRPSRPPPRRHDQRGDDRAMKLRPDEITKVLRQQIEQYDGGVDVEEVGSVLQVGDGIARIYGLEHVHGRRAAGVAARRDRAWRSTSKRTTSAPSSSATDRDQGRRQVKRTGRVMLRCRSARPCSAAWSTRWASRSTARARSRPTSSARSSSSRPGSSTASR